MDPQLRGYDGTISYYRRRKIAKVYGVGEGKAKNTVKEFADFIAKYVEKTILRELKIWC